MKQQKNKKKGDKQNFFDFLSPKNSNGSNKKPGKPKFNIAWVYIIIIIAFFILPLLNQSSQPKTTNWYDFENTMLKNNDVRKIVVVNKEKAEVYIKQDRLSEDRYDDVSSSMSGPHYVFNIGDLDRFHEQLDNVSDSHEISNVPVEYETRKDVLGDILSWFMPLLIIIIIWIIIFRKMSSRAGGGGPGNIFSVGKSKAKLFDKEGQKVKIDFSNVAGLEEAKVEIKEIVDFLKKPQKYTNLGGKIPKGALLVGPPGTGKTLLAKAVAGEADVPFFSISGSDFVEMFVGVGASRVRDLFKQAKEKAPCIVFIDEIDAIGRARGKNASFGSNDERENTLNQLLSEMDGFGDNSGVIIMSATNRVDILDKALLRAGRFDRQIHVDLPDLTERKAIFLVHLKPLKLDKSIDTDFLAKQTSGFSGADIANVCNEAALIAARNNKKQVTKQDFLDAVDRIVAGLERKSKVISPAEKKVIAYHESGHATVSWFLEHAHPLVKVTIVPRGRALGSAWYLPEERQITTKEQLLDEMCTTLGGRASEELTFDQVSTGALNDLERITKQAYAMVSFFGMSPKIGNISFFDSTGGNELSFNKPYSEKTAEFIDAEVKEIIETSYKRAKDLLIKHKDGLEKLANKLLEDEVIFKEDLEKIFGKRPYGDPDENLVTQKKTRARKKTNK